MGKFESSFSGSDPLVIIAEGDTVTIPDAHLLFAGDFSRNGTDLVVTGEAGKSVIVVDYFGDAGLPTLASPTGAVLLPDVVSALAGPQAPGQYAQQQELQAQEGIGRVVTLEGSATAQRTDGTVVDLQVDSRVAQGDVVQTGPGSLLGLVFDDGTVFNLNPNARMVLNELVYEPGGGSNSMLFSLVQGTFAFVAGQVAPTGEMRVDTPVASMGIRGTSGLVKLDTIDGLAVFRVIPDPVTGQVGTIALFQPGTNILLVVMDSSDVQWAIDPVTGQLIEQPADPADDDIIERLHDTFVRFAGIPTDQDDIQLAGGSGLQSQFALTADIAPILGLADGALAEGESLSTAPPVLIGIGDEPVDVEPVLLTLTPPPPPPPPVVEAEPITPIVVNQPPVAADDQLGDADTPFTDENTVMVIPVAELLANDSDPDGDPLSVVAVSGTSALGATVTLNPDGTITYDPRDALDDLETGEIVTDTFTYTISDGRGGIDEATVSLTVAGVAAPNQPPTAADDTFATDENTAVSGNVLANDSDPDGDPLAVTEVNGNPANVGAQIALPSGALLILNADGSFAYDPDGQFESLGVGDSAADSFTYTISDGRGGFDSATVSIDIAGVNDAPVIIGGNFTGAVTDPGAGAPTPLTPLAASYLTIGNVLVNGLGGPSGFGEDFLPANDDDSSPAIDLTAVFGPEGLNFFGTIHTSLFINNNGNVTFAAPLPDFTPASISAGIGNPIIAPFWGDVDTRGGPAPAPTPGGNSTGSNLLWWDLDSTNAVLTATWDDVGFFNDLSRPSDSDIFNAFQLQFVGLGGGDFEILFRYEAINWTAGDASGGTDGLGGQTARAGYNAEDGINAFELPQSGVEAEMLALPTTAGNTGIEGLHVFSVRSGVVVPSELTVSGTVQFIDVDINDTHTVSPFGTFLGPDTALGTLSAVLDSDTTGTGTGGELTWTYTVPTSAVSFLAEGMTRIESFEISVHDPFGGVATQVIDVTIIGANDPPAAVDDSFATDENTVVNGNVLANDSDPDGDPLTVTHVNASAGNVGMQITLASGALLLLEADGSFAYDPNSQFDSLSPGDTAEDSFTYTISDGQGGTDSATVTIEIAGVNTAPVILDGSTTQGAVQEDVTFVALGQMFAHDPDAGDTQTWSIVGGAQAHADYLVTIDNFTITKDGQLLFEDTFSDGNPPPSAPNFPDGNMATYFIGGEFGESDGRAIMFGPDALDPISGEGIEDQFSAHFAVLNTNIDPDSMAGLKSGASFTVEGRFDLSMPQALFETYGLGLTDFRLDQEGNDTVELTVGRNLGGDLVVQLHQINLEANSFSVLETIDLEPQPGDNQIDLRLTHDPEMSGAIHASFALVQNGVALTTVNFTETGQIFSDENWTRAQIVSAEPAQDLSVLMGNFGVISIDQQGQWQYTLANYLPAVQALEGGETIEDTFTARVTDSHGAFADQAITVTIAGRDDGPQWTMAPEHYETTDVEGEEMDLASMAIVDFEPMPDPVLGNGETSIDTASNGEEDLPALASVLKFDTEWTLDGESDPQSGDHSDPVGGGEPSASTNPESFGFIGMSEVAAAVEGSSDHAA